MTVKISFTAHPSAWLLNVRLDMQRSPNVRLVLCQTVDG